MTYLFRRPIDHVNSAQKQWSVPFLSHEFLHMFTQPNKDSFLWSMPQTNQRALDVPHICHTVVTPVDTSHLVHWYHS